MISRDEITIIGKFHKTHGIGGELSASFSSPLEVVKHCSCIVCDIDGIFVPFFINEMRKQSEQSAILSIDGLSNDQQAAILVNKDIYILRKEYQDLVDDDEVPVDFFIDFDAVINDNIHGTLVAIDDSTSNVLFVIKLDNENEVLIPAVDAFIKHFDNDKRTIHFNIPQELLDL